MHKLITLIELHEFDFRKNNLSLEGECHHLHVHNVPLQTMPFILATCLSCHLPPKALARVAIIIELQRELGVMEGKEIDCLIFINRKGENYGSLLQPEMKQRGKIQRVDSRWHEYSYTNISNPMGRLRRGQQCWRS